MADKSDTSPASDTPVEIAEKPTLKTIARLSGLAVPTVSRALNDAPDIGAETKRLIRRIADEIGYVPNRAGVRLRTGRTNVISMIISTDHDNQTGRLISSVAARLRGTPFHLNITPQYPDEDLLRPVRYVVENRSADAIIFYQTQPQDPRAAYLMERRFPFVTYGRTDWSDRHPWFDFDNQLFGEIAVKGLVRRGRRNLFVVAPPPTQAYAQHTIEGILTSAERLGVQATILPEVNSDMTIEQIRDRTTTWLWENPEVDGAICSSAAAAISVTGAMEAIGKRIGHDFDIFAKGSRDYLTLFRPQIGVVEEEPTIAGTFLSDATIRAVRSPDLPPMQGLDVPIDPWKDGTDLDKP